NREQMGVMKQEGGAGSRGYGDPGVMLILVYFIVILMMFFVGKALTMGGDGDFLSGGNESGAEETVQHRQMKVLPVKEV
ncbi:MAG: hypothetical protein OEV64_15640, partial [Desulfobulbaceae bacterium]|nr:hypothetical protein [Desulfobulbaceae bacterium]